MRKLWFIALALLAVATPARAERLTSSPVFQSSAISCVMSAANSVNVTTLVGPDGDAHVYVPTPADAKKIADAKLVFVNASALKAGCRGWCSQRATRP